MVKYIAHWSDDRNSFCVFEMISSISMAVFMPEFKTLIAAQNYAKTMNKDPKELVYRSGYE